MVKCKSKNGHKKSHHVGFFSFFKDWTTCLKFGNRGRLTGQDSQEEGYK